MRETTLRVCLLKNSHNILRIRVRFSCNIRNVQPVAQRIVDTLNHFPLLHDLRSEAYLVAPVDVAAAPQVLVTKSRVLDDAQSAQLAAHALQLAVHNLDALRRRRQAYKRTVRSRQVQRHGQQRIQRRQRNVPHVARRPVEAVQVHQAQRAGIRLVAVRAGQIDVRDGNQAGADGGPRAPLAARASRPGRAGDEGDGDEVGEVRPQHPRDGKVQVALGLVRVTKGALGHDGVPKLQVQQAALEVDKLAAQDLVGRRQRAAGPQRGDAVEEHVGRDLQAALGLVEHVFRREKGERLEEEEQRQEGEDGEGVAGRRGERLDGYAGGFRGVADGAVVGYRLGEEDRAEEDEEGLDAARLLAWRIRLVLSQGKAAYEDHGIAMVGDWEGVSPKGRENRTWNRYGKLVYRGGLGMVNSCGEHAGVAC